MSVPELRFPEFEGEWEEKRINELFEFLPTNSFSRAKLNNESGNVKNIHYGDIHTKFPSNLDCDNVNIPFINYDVDLSKVKTESYCKNGDLVIADASEDYDDIGKAIELRNVNNKRILAGLHTFLARDKSGLTAEGYRGYMLLNKSIKLDIKKIATGISVLGISKTNLGKLKIKLPSIPEQEKIASFLSAVDEKIENLEKKQVLWEAYKKGMMQKIFSQELRFKDENGEEYPEWIYLNFSEIFESISTSKYQIKSSEISQNGNFIVIDQGKNLIAGFSNHSSKVFIDIPVIVYGDHTTFVKYTENKFIIGADGTKLLKSKINSKLKYLYYSLDFFNVKPEGYKRHFSILRNLNLPIPFIQEQEKICYLLSNIDIKLEKIKKELEISQDFKKGLLQKMFC